MLKKFIVSFSVAAALGLVFGAIGSLLKSYANYRVDSV